MQRGIQRLARLWTILLVGVVASLLCGLAMRWLVPLSPWVETPTVQLRDPLPQSQTVPPRSPITLAFSTPMNPFTVIRALRIDPPLAATYQWSDDMRVLQIVPAQPLQPATVYRIHVATNAQSRWWRPLSQPLDVTFVTAAQPTIRTALAPRRLDAPIALIFSQPMVAEDAVGQLMSLAQIRLSPPWPLSGEWLDPQTLLLQPLMAFTAATTYTLTIDTTLRDARGVELGQPFRWQFSTPWPQLIAQTPPPEARWVNPQQPLVLVFDAPIDTRLLSSVLDITPPISGDMTGVMDDGRYIVSFTPYTGWVPGQTYQVRLRTGETGAALSSWRFYVEPEPTLIASFPGQGQSLLPDQEIRLIFSTPMDETELRAGLRFDPPVNDVHLTVDDNRVSLRPAVQAATTYTITIAAGTRDRSGVPIQNDILLTIRTASSPPTLRVVGDLLQRFPANATPAITIERMNLNALNAQLYQLDAATLIRAISLRSDEWPGFIPERYGQPLVRAWREILADPPDELVRSVFSLTSNSEGALLPPGAYYLRLTADNGLRVDQLLLVSAIRLTVVPNGNELLLWVTSNGNGKPLSAIPLTMYLDEALISRGTSNEQGVWRVPLTGLGTLVGSIANRTIIAIAEGEGIALARTVLARSTGSETLALLAPDRLSYRPGGIVRISGIVRERQPDGRATLPTDTSCRLKLDGPKLAGEPTAVTCTINDTGQLNGSLRLDARTAPGTYTVQVSIGETTYAVPIQVFVPTTATTIRVTPTLTNSLAIDVVRAGLPVAGVAVSWTLRLETLSTPELDGTSGDVLGSAAETLASATTDQSGRVQITLPAAEALIRPLRYRLDLTAQLPDGEQLPYSAEGIIAPRSPRLAIEVPRVIERGERARVTISLQQVDGLPIPNSLVELEVRRTSNDPPLLVRRVRTNAGGTANTDLAPLAPGRYEVTARSGLSVSRRQLWVAGSGIATAEPMLVTDRTAYTVGETARLLISGPTGGGTLLLIAGQGDTARTILTTLQPGTIIPFPITNDLPPTTLITALIDDGTRLWVRTAVLQIDPPASPLLSLPQTEVVPGTTITLTVTAPMSTFLTTLTPIHAPAINLDPWNQPLVARRTTHPLSGLPGIVVPSTVQSTGDQHQISLRLPQQSGRWRLDVIAIADSGTATATGILLDTFQPVEAIAIPLPPLRNNDTVVATLILRNIDAQARTVRVRLLTSGGTLLDPPEQTITIPASTTVHASWQLQTQADVSIVGLRYEVIDSVPLPPIEYAVPVVHDERIATSSQTRLVSDPLELTILDGDTEIAVAPNARSALADQAQRLLQSPAPTADMLAAALIIGHELQRTAPPTTDTERWQAAVESLPGQLRTLRNPDGGWGWWPHQPSDPFITAFVLEAIARINNPSNQTNPLSDPGILYLRRSRTTATPDLQAYIDYVLSLHGVTDGSAGLTDPPGPTGRAFSALHRTQDRSKLLAQFWSTAGGGLPWAGAEGMPSSALAVSASVVQALSSDRPSDPRLTTWRTALLRRWDIDGWPTPYEAARVALALGDTLKNDNAGVRVWYNNDLLTTTSPNDVVRWQVRGGVVRIEPLRGPALIAIRSQTTERSPIEDLRVRLSYRPSSIPLAVNQPVQIEVLLLVRTSLIRCDVTIPLPAGLTPVRVGNLAEFSYVQIDRERRSVQLSGVNLPPGVYRFTVTAQSTTAGSFHVPPILIATPGSGLPLLVEQSVDQVLDIEQ